MKLAHCPSLSLPSNHFL